MAKMVREQRRMEQKLDQIVDMLTQSAQGGLNRSPNGGLHQLTPPIQQPPPSLNFLLGEPQPPPPPTEMFGRAPAEAPADAPAWAPAATAAVRSRPPPRPRVLGIGSRVAGGDQRV
eukprot:7383750-Prymnesium_polylepis.2